MTLKEVKLGTKILLGFGTMLILILFISLVSLFTLKQTNTSFNEITNVYNKKVTLADSMRNNVVTIQTSIRNLMISNSSDYKNQEKSTIEGNIKAYSIYSKELEKLIHTDKEKNLFKEAQKSEQEAVLIIDNVIKTSLDYSTDLNGSQIMLTKLTSPEQNWLSSIQAIVDYQNQLSQTASKNAALKEAETERLMYIIIIIAIVLSALFSRLLRKNISKQMQELLIAANKLAEGDLNFNIKAYSNDEIGKTSRALNTAVKTLKDMITEIRNESSVIIENAIITEEMFDKITKQVETVSASTEEISACMDESCLFSEDITLMASLVKEKADNSTENSKEGLKLALNIQENAETISQNAIASKENVKQIYLKSKEQLEKAINDAKVVQKISQMANAILEISEQTNLLALNAAIEAAHAGEQGKGFAIVAEEVRTLAEQSSKTVNEIQSYVKNVLSAVDELSDASKYVLMVIEKDVLEDYENLIGISSKYKQDGATFKNITEKFSEISEKISDSIDKIVGCMSNIASTSIETAKSSGEIASNVGKVTEDNIQVLSQIKNNAEIAKKLSMLMEKFKIE